LHLGFPTAWPLSSSSTTCQPLILFMRFMKMVGALVNPKGTTKYS
jgi:hypothetical protein